MTAEELKKSLVDTLERYLEVTYQTGEEWDVAKALNEEMARNIKQLRNEGRISLGPTERDISLFDVPLDILPMVPFVIPEIDRLGRYNVLLDGRCVGHVVYNGFPEQRPGACAVGIVTTFCFDNPIECIDMKLEGLEATI